MAIIEGILVEELLRLFRDNMQKLYKLLENVILEKESQFVVKLIRELNRMLEIKNKIVNGIPLIDKQIDRMNKLRAETVLNILYRV